MNGNKNKINYLLLSWIFWRSSLLYIRLPDGLYCWIEVNLLLSFEVLDLFDFWNISSSGLVGSLALSVLFLLIILPYPS